MSKNVSLEDIVSLCKRRGFIYQGSEVYGGLSGTWDYGPLGVTLKRNIMNLWWQRFVNDRDDMYGVDAAILMNTKTWVASGHVNGFFDPTVIDLITQKPYRADHLLEDQNISVKGMTISDMNKTIREKSIKSPDNNELSAVFPFNMMLKTHMGASSVDIVAEGYGSLSGTLEVKDQNGFATKVDIKTRKNTNAVTLYDISNVTYLRPETAQGIFTNFRNIVDSLYPDLPFGIAQQGKAFRNEISPRDFVFRSREFEQMEIEYFVESKDWERVFDKWVKDIHSFLDELGLPKESIHELEVSEEDRAHYSKRTIDFEFDYPHKRDELLGLAYRTDFDLKNIQDASGKSMEYRPKDGSKPFIPHVIEPSFGVERAVMAVLVSAYTEDEIGGEKRIVLKLPKHLAPVRVAVSPLLKNKPELVEKAREVYKMLKKDIGNVMWDDNGNIGKRYRRQDEIGTPYCVTIDFETLENDTVTVRDRDTTKQKRVPVSDLTESVQDGEK